MRFEGQQCMFGKRAHAGRRCQLAIQAVLDMGYRSNNSTSSSLCMGVLVLCGVYDTLSNDYNLERCRE